MPPEISDREHLERIINERHQLYTALFDASQTAVTAALAAQKELTQAAFQSSEKAIVKAENAQSSYNTTHNDLSRKMDAQYEHMMPRHEAHALLDALKDKVTALEKTLAAGSGKSAGLSAGWGYLVGAVGIGLALAAAFKG